MSDIQYKAEGIVKVNSRLNVRQGNGTGTSIIGKLTPNTIVTITHKTSDKKFNDLGTMRGGYKISYKGGSAYVCDRYVTITKQVDASNVSNNTENTATTDTYILTGSANIEPNLSLRVRDTVNMQGLGKYLSGAYFIEEITYEFSNSGFKQSIAVSKNAFGESINSGNVSTNTPKPVVPVVTPPKTEVRTHTLKNGETLWSLAVKYYKNGTKWTVIAKANGINPSDEKTIRSLKNGRVFKIPYL